MKLMKTKKHGFFTSFIFAWRGIVWNLLNERNMKFHFAAMIIASLMAIYFQISTSEWLALIIFFALIPTAELINSAVEETCNTLRDSLHLGYQATKLPRDLAAGAVLWSSIFAGLTGICIFLPRIINLFLSCR